MSKKESAVDLAKFIDKGVRVKLAGGREGEYSMILNPCAASQPRIQTSKTGSSISHAVLRQSHVVSAAHRCGLSATDCCICSSGLVLLIALFFPAVSGVLKGYDQLLNLVLDEAVEYLRGRTVSDQAADSGLLC